MVYFFFLLYLLVIATQMHSNIWFWATHLFLFWFWFQGVRLFLIKKRSSLAIVPQVFWRSFKVFFFSFFLTPVAFFYSLCIWLIKGDFGLFISFSLYLLCHLPVIYESFKHNMTPSSRDEPDNLTFLSFYLSGNIQKHKWSYQILSSKLVRLIQTQFENHLCYPMFQLLWLKTFARYCK